MRAGNSRRARAHLSRGVLLSLLLHAHLLTPLLIAAFILGGRQEAQRPDEIDVAWQEVKPEELPQDLPALEPPRATPEPPDRPDRLRPERKKKLKPPARADKTNEPDKVDKKAEKKLAEKPEPEVVVPPLPPMPEPPPPPPERRDHEKMVDLDNDKEVEPPPDAKFLAQKNNRAAEETRATDTALEKSKRSAQTQMATAEEERIAQLEEQKSKAGKKAPEVTPHADPELADAPPPRERSLLALRDPAPRRHELTPETADLSVPRAPDGDVPLPQRPVRGEKSDPARGRGKRVKLALSDRDYEYLFGADAEAERRLAQKQRSTKVGKFQRKQAQIVAALENFIPEVKPGNQTALNTRAAPFAAYIAQMHRSIHQMWGFGQLVDWDAKSGSSPFNDQNLYTTLEMVLNGDGTVEKVTVVRTSGYLPYDVAAIDVAYSAGPYPDPPREIRSANGKIYIHWKFHRDGRQCATSGVDYFILNNPAPGSDKPSVAELPAAAHPHAPQGPAGAAGAAAPIEPGPRRLERLEPVARRLAVGPAAPAAAAAPARGGPAAGEQPPADVVPRAENPAARAVAERWFSALAGGDAGGMADLAGFPFKTMAGSDAPTRSALVAMLKDLVSESPRRRPARMQVLTSAGARAVLGRLPAISDEGTGVLFAIAEAGPHDTLVLVLAQRGGIWKAVGLTRR